MTPQEVLLKAAEDIETRGLYKTSYWEIGGDPVSAQACSYGAMARAASGKADYCILGYLPATEPLQRLVDQAADLLAAKIPSRTWDSFSRVTQYNDLPETTAEDVAGLMREAAGS